MEPDDLEKRARSLDFVSMVRLLENAYPEKPRVGTSERVAEDVLRISQHVSMGFQGTALHALEKGTGRHQHRLYCNFFGLLGSNGPMPVHYTEYADQRDRHFQDPTFKEFLDIFNQRMLSLFYRASVQFDPVVNLDRADNHNFLDFAGALSGLVPQTATGRDAFPDSGKYYYCGWFGSKAKSPDGLVSMVQDYFGVGASVKEFTGAWLLLPENARTVLGDPNQPAALGGSTYIGKRVWSIAHRFVLSIGPLSWNSFLSFKPGSSELTELYDLVRNYMGDEWAWELELQIKKGEARPTQLNHQSVLGFSSFIGPSKAISKSSKKVTLGRSALCKRSVAAVRSTTHNGVTP